MTILDKRNRFTPFEYKTAYEYWEKQQSSHWNSWDITYSDDLNDWRSMSDTERQIVGGVLRGFTQAEITVNDYWVNAVHKWFPKPEISLMSSCFASMEGVHAVSYNQLSETLGLDTYEAFQQDPSAVAKISYLTDIDLDNCTLSEKAQSLAIFSGFTEGVSLFSSFSILQWFSTKNKLKGVASVITYSIRDENLHSKAGIWLFKQLLVEYPEIDTVELRLHIEEAARAIVELEHNFIESVFKLGDLDGLAAKDLKAFILLRTNNKLVELGYQPVFSYVKEDAENIISWFNILNGAERTVDFFATNVPDYATIELDESNLDWG